MLDYQQTDLLDLTVSNAEVGFRLERLEVYNWGTFDKHVWSIEPKRENSLLTGDIGSGKSTLVDAITTLLVPHNKIVYNKAAGAESKERSLYSYIRGEYKSEKDDFTQSAKAIALRDENHYTVLLGNFYNTGYSQGITLAQVFWLKDGKRNPERFFVVAEDVLSIKKHFTGIQGDILFLKKQLRQSENIQIFDNFKEYSNYFRKVFGIHNEQALELFYQTVSMKSVGNFTEFVRNHMLEKYSIDERIDELRTNFENLNRSHEAILKAKKQIAHLRPLADDITSYNQLVSSVAELRECREGLQSYFATLHSNFLKDRIDQLQGELISNQQKLTACKQEIVQLNTQESALNQDIYSSGGQRLQVIDQETLRLSDERIRREALFDRYHHHAEKLNLSQIKCEDEFWSNRKKTQSLLEKIESRQHELQLKQVDLRIDIKSAQKEVTEIQAELESLQKRDSNIPVNVLALRQDLAIALNISEDMLPFVGELLQVNNHSRNWEGAIERLLHNFGLSLLVAEEYYEQVNQYVERTHLKGRLVYFRVRLGSYPKQQIIHNSLVDKISIKPDSIFYSWLSNEIYTRFEYICCESFEEFKRLPQAITVNGLIKSKGQRHQKDDRHLLGDRSRYILGWSNKNKIAALKAKIQIREQYGQELFEKLSILAKEHDQIVQNRDICRDLLSISNFVELDWQSIVKELQNLLEEKQQIETSSNVLQTLQSQLENVKQQITSKVEILTQRERRLGAIEQQLEDRKQELVKAELLATNLNHGIVAKLDEYKSLVLTTNNIATLSLSNIDKCQSDTRYYIQRKIDSQESKQRKLIGSITQQMQSYKQQYPAETCEVTATPDLGSEYIKMLESLETEDLPRHEVRFKELLNEGTINSLALLQNQLNREKQEIQERIETINKSLQEIEYNPGTFIKLLFDPTQDVEIRDFQQQLRLCLQNTLNDQKYYNEDKFLQVKAIIERFNGRENFIDIDRKWTQKVCNVRNWFTFSASERWQEDKTEKEFFSDSSGKSGGQKEKLAYTILASALAYQFGLEWGKTHSRSFRFVVIDEAFGKGSNDSTRYGLELFKKLNLQLLIVTPLQKIHVIEDYIKTIHFVENCSGASSVIRNLAIEEYFEEKESYHELPDTNTIHS